MNNAIGGIEISSIAHGYGVADAMLKAADVELLANQTLCPGKSMLLIGGSNSSVQSALDAGVRQGDSFISDKVLIGNIHAEVLSVLKRSSKPKEGLAIGIVEAYTAVGAIEAADMMVKGSSVVLNRVNTQIGIGGKGIVTVSGDVAAVSMAVGMAHDHLKLRNIMVNTIVIPNPNLDILVQKKT